MPVEDSQVKDNSSVNDTNVSVRLAKEEDRTYLSRLLYLTNVFGDESAEIDDNHEGDMVRYIDNWSALVDGGVIAQSELGVPAGGSWLRYFTHGRKGAAYMGNPEVADPESGIDPHDESQWATEHDPETIPELCIAVENRYQRLGLGRILLRNVCDLAKAQEAPAIALWVDPNNPRARKLYESEGFEDIDIPGGKDGAMIKRFY